MDVFRCAQNTTDTGVGASELEILSSAMEFSQETLQSCTQSTGVVVVIDVIRAFTTAAFAFAQGAESITLVSTVDEAYGLREQIPDSMIMGEVKGLPPDGFDFGNSPTEIVSTNLKNSHLIQRTSAGTQGVVNSSNAETLLTAGFTNAQATVNFISKLAPKNVSFVITGLGPDGRGEEDLACAEYLESQLSGAANDAASYLMRVEECRTSQVVFADPEKTLFPWQDIKYCTDLDRFNFAMVVTRANGRFVMKPVLV